MVRNACSRRESWFPHPTGLTAAELATIRGRLEAFADDIFASLARADQRARGQCYLRGLMLNGRRKSIEPMAARLGEVHYQALHHFVAASPWDWRPVRRRLAEVLCGALSPTAWVVDDTGFPKDGDHSVGVQRQYSGTLGKTANCQLGVSVNAITEHASCPLDWRLFVPESWDEAAMATRRAACHLPEQVHHRPKWQLVLDMLDELAGWDLHPPVLLADSGYGEVGEFRWGLDARQIPYVVEVRADTSAYPEHVHPVAAPYSGKGRRPQPRYHHTPSSLKELALAAGQQACVDLIWRRGSKGLQRGRFLALRVRPAGVTPRWLARQAGGELPLRCRTSAACRHMTLLGLLWAARMLGRGGPGVCPRTHVPPGSAPHLPSCYGVRTGTPSKGEPLTMGGHARPPDSPLSSTSARHDHPAGSAGPGPTAAGPAPPTLDPPRLEPRSWPTRPDSHPSPHTIRQPAPASARPSASRGCRHRASWARSGLAPDSAVLIHLVARGAGVGPPPRR